MEALNLILPVLLYITGIILLIVLIILGLRLIQVLNKVDRVIDNIEEKVNSFNNVFDVVSKATDSLALIGESFVGSLIGFVSKIFSKKFKNEEDHYE